jgi:two-component system chemotaxis response regulator CheB
MTVSVLIVDDSATCRAALRQALESDPEIRVIGEAADGRHALGFLLKSQPDIITMDVLLGGPSGLEITESIMATTPRPILILTSLNPADPDLAYRAIRAGALEVWPKLPSAASPEYAKAREELIRVVKDLSHVPVVHRWVRGSRAPDSDARRERLPAPVDAQRPRVLGIGASTGGPPVVGSLLERLPPPLPVAVIIVQHIAAGFADGFADWLRDTTEHDVTLVTGPVDLQAGTVYVAPDDQHLELASPRRLETCSSPPRHRHRPSIDVLFLSMARRLGAGSVGVLLTGMGEDGVEGLAGLRRAGALTIVQEPKSCAVDSMPRHAIAREAARLVLTPDEIGAVLLKGLGAAASDRP